MKAWISVLLMGACCSACQSPLSVWDLALPTLAGPVFPLDSLKQNAVSVLVFMSPECPLCENYARNLGQMADSFAADGVKFYGVFPGKDYPNIQIHQFLLHYRVPFPALLDTGLVLTRKLDATTTPEVVVYNHSGTLVYRGSIDNWVVSLGQKRTVVTAHYLEDAIQAALLEKPVSIPETQPTGCLIQR